jgi:hypothetical protein
VKINGGQFFGDLDLMGRVRGFDRLNGHIRVNDVSAAVFVG